MEPGQTVTVTVGPTGTDIKARYIEKSRYEPDYHWLESTEEKFYYKKGEMLIAYKDSIKETSIQ